MTEYIVHKYIVYVCRSFDLSKHVALIKKSLSTA